MCKNWIKLSYFLYHMMPLCTSFFFILNYFWGFLMQNVSLVSQRGTFSNHNSSKTFEWTLMKLSRILYHVMPMYVSYYLVFPSEWLLELPDAKLWLLHWSTRGHLLVHKSWSCWLLNGNLHWSTRGHLLVHKFLTSLS